MERQFSIRYLLVIVAIVAVALSILTSINPYQYSTRNLAAFQVSITLFGAIVGLARGYVLLGVALGFLISAMWASMMPILFSL